MPVQRPPGAKLLVAGPDGQHRTLAPRATSCGCFRAGDLVIANDAATLPASLPGSMCRSGREIEVRLAGRDSLDRGDALSAVLFGPGDFRTRTEDRPLPPPVHAGRPPGARPAARDASSAARSSAPASRCEFEGSPDDDLGRTGAGTAGRSSTRT